MKKFLVLLPLLTTPTHAESYVTDVTSCTSDELMVQYTRDVHVIRKRLQVEELAMMGGECVYRMTAFTVIEKTVSFIEKGVQYSIMKVETSAGIRYVMYYEPAPPEA